MTVDSAASQELAVLDGRLWSGCSDEELVDGVHAIQAQLSQLAALQAELLAEVDDRDVAKKRLHRPSTAEWFARVAGLARRDGRRTVAHAHALLGERAATLDALRSGGVTPWKVPLNPVDHRPEFLPPPARGTPPVELEWIRHRPRRE